MPDNATVFPSLCFIYPCGNRLLSHMKSVGDNVIKGEATGIEVIQDPHTIQELYMNLVKSAKYEISLVLPTSSSFKREQKIGILQSLVSAAERGVRIYVLTPADAEFTPEMHSLLKGKNINIGVRRIRHKSENHRSDQARTKILLVSVVLIGSLLMFAGLFLLVVQCAFIFG